MTKSQVETLFQTTDLLIGRIIYLISLSYTGVGQYQPAVFHIGNVMTVELISMPFDINGKEVCMHVCSNCPKY